MRKRELAAQAGKQLLLLAFAVLAGFVLLLAAFALPTERIWQNVGKSAAILWQETDYAFQGVTRSAAETEEAGQDQQRICARHPGCGGDGGTGEHPPFHQQRRQGRDRKGSRKW